MRSRSITDDTGVFILWKAEKKGLASMGATRMEQLTKIIINRENANEGVGAAVDAGIYQVPMRKEQVGADVLGLCTASIEQTDFDERHSSGLCETATNADGLRRNDKFAPMPHDLCAGTGDPRRRCRCTRPDADDDYGASQTEMANKVFADARDPKAVAYTHDPYADANDSCETSADAKRLGPMHQAPDKAAAGAGRRCE
ncbi:hypothetical protein MSAN_01282700 [Mycena sanguinolenta]|uniref:Uncharacterized protein n=1 Tax=Mycena sanguinolenta TaxID=230812 RepID=A0A8H6YIL8_9AGAR|nr:hypothetical protein MSAN_01282700 [Mycena sanguinolenta]